MRSLRAGLVAGAAAALLAAPAGGQTPKKCPIESVKVGNVCVDKYEASAWQIPAASNSLIKRVKAGKADLADLQAGGATQLGCDFAPFNLPPYPATFPGTGNWTDPVYAVSVPGVLPSTCVTWFQAEQACALAGKRLVTNQEWQRAAAGTPDPGATPGPADCNTNSAGPVNTGSRANCVSAWGVFDMVGNVDERVSDWGDVNTNGCSNWDPTFGSDRTCVGGDGTSNFPGTLIRGGVWVSGANAGVFAVDGTNGPLLNHCSVGFRCAR